MNPPRPQLRIEEFEDRLLPSIDLTSGVGWPFQHEPSLNAVMLNPPIATGSDSELNARSPVASLANGLDQTGSPNSPAWAPSNDFAQQDSGNGFADNNGGSPIDASSLYAGITPWGGQNNSNSDQNGLNPPNFNGSSNGDLPNPPNFNGSSNGDLPNNLNFNGYANGNGATNPNFNGYANGNGATNPNFNGYANGDGATNPNFNGYANGNGATNPNFNGPSSGSSLHENPPTGAAESGPAPVSSPGAGEIIVDIGGAEVVVLDPRYGDGLANGHDPSWASHPETPPVDSSDPSSAKPSSVQTPGDSASAYGSNNSASSVDSSTVPAMFLVSSPTQFASGIAVAAEPYGQAAAHALSEITIAAVPLTVQQGSSPVSSPPALSMSFVSPQIDSPNLQARVSAGAKFSLPGPARGLPSDRRVEAASIELIIPGVDPVTGAVGVDPAELDERVAAVLGKLSLLSKELTEELEQPGVYPWVLAGLLGAGAAYTVWIGRKSRSTQHFPLGCGVHGPLGSWEGQNDKRSQ